MLFTKLSETTGMKMPTLNAIVAEYVKLGVVIPEGGLKNNSEKIDFIQLTAKDVGIPHAVTEEDMASVPTGTALAENGVKLGDMILVPLPTEDEVPPPQPPQGDDAPDSPENGAGEDAGAGDDEDDEEESTDAPEADSEVSDDVVDEEGLLADIIAGGKLFYEGKRIIRVSNRVANGRLFKDLDCGESRFSVTADEFAEIVRNIK